MQTQVRQVVDQWQRSTSMGSVATGASANIASVATGGKPKAVDKIRLYNGNAADRDVTISFDPVGAVGETTIEVISVTAGNTIELGGGELEPYIFLAAGDALKALASGAGVVATLLIRTEV